MSSVNTLAYHSLVGQTISLGLQEGMLRNDSTDIVEFLHQVDGAIHGIMWGLREIIPGYLSAYAGCQFSSISVCRVAMFRLEIYTESCLDECIPTRVVHLPYVRILAGWILTSPP